jgi:MFS family permease
MGLFYMGAPLALTLGSPLSGALLEMHGFMGHPGWFWMFVIEGLLAVGAGVFTFFWLDDTPEQARFLSKQEKTLLINQLASEEQQKVTSRLSDALRNGAVLYGRTAGVNTGITAFRRAVGDAWIYGASRLVLDVCD